MTIVEASSKLFNELKQYDSVEGTAVCDKTIIVYFSSKKELPKIPSIYEGFTVKVEKIGKFRFL